MSRKRSDIRDFFEENRYEVCVILCVLIVTVVCLWNVGEHDRVRRVYDEIGYWGIAARLSGYNWEDIMNSISYYSFGYSILLVPLFWLFRMGVSISFCYKIAIVLNVIMLDLSIFLAAYVAEKWAPKINKYYRLLCVLVITLYNNNIMQTNTAWPETCIYFLYWCILALSIRVFEYKRFRDVAGLIGLSAYLFVVHMRTVAVPIAVGIILGIFFYNDGRTKKARARGVKIQKKQVIIIAAIIAGIIIVLLLKGFVQNSIYGMQGGEEASLRSNTFASALPQLKYFFSLDGWKDVILSFLGKIYYQGIASFLLVYYGFGLLVKRIIISVKEAKEYGEDKILKPVDYWGILIILITFGSIMVSTLFTLNPLYSGEPTWNRADRVIYGRYTEFLLSAFLLFGLLALGQMKRHAELVGISMLTMMITAWAVQHQWDMLSFYMDLIAQGLEGIEHYFKGGFDGTAYAAAVCAIGIFGSICFLCMCGNKVFKSISRRVVVVLLLLYFVINGMYNAENMSIQKANKLKHVVSIVDLLKEVPEVPIYCIGEVTQDIAIVQWELPDHSIQLIDSSELQEIADEECIIISAAEHDIIGRASEYIDFLYSSESIAIYANENTHAGQVMIENINEARNTINPLGGTVDLSVSPYENGIWGVDEKVHSVKKEGFITKNTELQLVDGIYEFVVDIELENYKGKEIGYVLATNEEATFENVAVINEEDVKRGKIEIVIQAEAKNYSQPYIMVYDYGNCDIRVTGIEYKQLESVTPRNAEEQDELQRILDIIEEGLRSYHHIYYIDCDGSGVAGDPKITSGKYGSFTEEDMKITQLPYYAVKYLDNKQMNWFIVEKTGEYEKIIEFLNGYFCRYETRNFMLFEEG